MNGDYGVMEYDGLGEYEWDMEDLGEDEWEGFDDYEFEDMEGDPFFGRLLRSPILKKLARRAAATVGRAVGGPTGGRIAATIAKRVIREGEYEFEEEFEEEFEADFEAEGGDMEVLAEMEYLAEMAAETESEAEADEFLGALASLAGPLISSLLGESEFEDEYEYEYELYEYEEEGDEFFGALASGLASLLPMAMPLIKKGARALGGLLRRSRRSRRGRRESEAGIKAIPKIVAKTATTIKQQAKAGKPITRKKVAAIMARTVAKTLANPRTLAKTVKRNRGMARRAKTKTHRILPRRSRVRRARSRVLPA